MDALGITPIAIPTVQVVSAPISQSSGPSNSTPTLPLGSSGTQNNTVDLQVAAERRLQAVQQKSQDVANVYVLGDQQFTIFKDSTGQYITRYTSLRDGKVTYIPEPQLFKIGGSSSPAVSISA